MCQLAKHYFFVLLLVTLVSVTAFCQLEGKLTLESTVPHPMSPENKVIISQIIWYSGDALILQVPHLSSSRDSSGIQSEVVIKSFLFMEQEGTRNFYYRNFSDTAKLIAKGPRHTAFEKYGGWDIFSKRRFPYTDSLTLPDTVIGTTVYGRYLFGSWINGKRLDYVLYQSCEWKYKSVNILNAFSTHFTCPIVMMMKYFDGRLAESSKLTVTSLTLTNEERMVFAAWLKNPKEK